MITPRRTRLLRAADPSSFRRAVVSLCLEGAPLDARSRLVVVPTRAAASLLVAALERAVADGPGAVLHPEFATAREVAWRIGERAAPGLGPTRPEAREIVMGVACRTVAVTHPPPFALRPGLVAEVLAFYDALARNRYDVDRFERLALGRLAPGAEYDRGAERLVRQTRFLVAAFTAFEQLRAEHGLIDEGQWREIAIATPAEQPWRHVIVTVGEHSRDPHGLCPADWDLLTRVAGLERLDLVVTDRVLAGAWHERVHELLPDIEEVRIDAAPPPPIVLRVPRQAPGAAATGSRHPRLWMSRDREEEVADFARWVRALRRRDVPVPLDSIALVVNQPLPYVYLSREVLRSAGIPCRTFETLPLAAEPYAAALDLVLTAVRTQFARDAGIALLRSPYFAWAVDGRPLRPESTAAADAWLSERGFLGGVDALERMLAAAGGEEASRGAAHPALQVLCAAAAELAPLHEVRPAGDHLDLLLQFLRTHAARSLSPDAGPRETRARGAVHGILSVLRDEFRTLDTEPVPFDLVDAVLRRWIESHTFAPQTGDGGVHVLDADTARFGDFACVQLAGLVEGEWPHRQAGNIFYGLSLLRDLGWSAASEPLDHARAAFQDLLELPSALLTVSAFTLEEDTTVAPSAFADELHSVAAIAEDDGADRRVFEVEALGLEPVSLDGLEAAAAAAARWRLARPPADAPGFHGQTAAHHPAAFSLSGLERYQDCPFRFFATDVLKLREIPEDEPFLSPRARGRFIHEVFERFFRAWDAGEARTITAENLDAARATFVEIAEPLLARLPESDATLERARLFGSAIAAGIVDIVLGLEASRPAVVRGRWLETRFDGPFSLGDAHGPRVRLNGVADRVDLLDQRRLRVIDYKTGRAPDPRRALQVPIYALCAQERLKGSEEAGWAVDEAAYIAFTGRRALVPVIASGTDAEPALAAARERLLQVVAAVEQGAFPPRPHEAALCRSCAYPSVCRKDYVDAES